MAVDALPVLYGAVLTAFLNWLYGLVIAVFWSPFLFAGRLRRFLDSLPPADWRLNYVVWLPFPAALWGFLFGIGLSVSPELRQPGRASPLYLGGVDGIVVASLVSLVLWPALLLYVLPGRGFDWSPGGRSPTTVALVVGGTVWYLLFLVVPWYALSVFAGFGDAMAGP